MFSADGSLVVYSSQPSLVVRDAHTLALRQRLSIGPPFSQQLAADIPEGSTLVAPGGRTVYYAYWLLDAEGQPSRAYLARWALPSGRELGTVSLGAGPLLAVRLIDAGARLMVVTARQIDTYDASTLRPVQAVTVQPVPLLPSAAAISPAGTTVTIGSQNGTVSLVDAATGVRSEAMHGHSGPVASAVYAPDGGTVVTVGDDGRVIVWNPRSGTQQAVLSGPGDTSRMPRSAPTARRSTRRASVAWCWHGT